MRSLIVTTLAATLPMLVAAPAGAVRGNDDRDDVRYYESADDRDPEKVDRADGDLTAYRFTYVERRITAVLHFDRLSKEVPDRLLLLSLRYRGRDGDLHYPEVEVEASDGDPVGTARFQPDDGPRCAVAHEIEYRHDNATLSFSASCIESADKLRMFASAEETDDLEDPSYLYVDRAPGGQGQSDHADGVLVKRG